MFRSSKKKKKERRDSESQTQQVQKISDPTSVLHVPVMVPRTQNARWPQHQGLPYGVSNGHQTLARPLTQQTLETHVRSAISLPTAVYGSLQAASKSVTNLSKDVWHQASA